MTGRRRPGSCRGAGRPAPGALPGPRPGRGAGGPCLPHPPPADPRAAGSPPIRTPGGEQARAPGHARRQDQIPDPQRSPLCRRAPGRPVRGTGARAGWVRSRPTRTPSGRTRRGRRLRGWRLAPDPARLPGDCPSQPRSRRAPGRGGWGRSAPGGPRLPVPGLRRDGVRDGAGARAGAPRSSPRQTVLRWPGRPDRPVAPPAAIAVVARSGSRPCLAHRAGPADHPAAACLPESNGHRGAAQLAESNGRPGPNRHATPDRRRELAPLRGPESRAERNHRGGPGPHAEPAGRGRLIRQAAPRAPPARPTRARPAVRAQLGPGCRHGRFCPRRPRPRHRHQVLDRPRGRACRTGHAPGRGPRSDRPARRRHPVPGPGNRCGRGTRSAPEGRSPQPRGLQWPGRAPLSRPLRTRESHRGPAGPARAPGRAQASHPCGDRGRRKSHSARRAPHGGQRPAGAPRARTVRAAGPPGNCGCPRLGLCPVPDRRLARPARRARRHRALHPGRRGVRSRGSRCRVHRYVRNHRQAGRTSEALTDPKARPVRCRPPRLPRASLDGQAGPDSPRWPASPLGPPGCAGPAPSRGTAVTGTDAGAGHRGTRVRDRRSHALAAHAAVPAGPRRSSVPLPCL